MGVCVGRLMDLSLVRESDKQSIETGNMVKEPGLIQILMSLERGGVSERMGTIAS